MKRINLSKKQAPGISQELKKIVNEPEVEEKTNLKVINDDQREVMKVTQDKDFPYNMSRSFRISLSLLTTQLDYGTLFSRPNKAFNRTVNRNTVDFFFAGFCEHIGAEDRAVDAVFFEFTSEVENDGFGAAPFVRDKPAHDVGHGSVKFTHGDNLPPAFKC